MKATETAMAVFRPMAGSTMAMMAVAEISWGMMLMKVPMEERMDTARPTCGPYSARMMLTNVAQPVRRRGRVYTNANTRQAMPAPSVYHQADMPN